ncbi:hypothetical protein, partial [Phocaeicola vulgatus]|uniref:hypothetical protein n=1 Tax=Phocaeicola vulgatus TaxID=821 RepID=UPI001C8722C2
DLQIDLAAYGFSCKFSGFHSIRKAAPSDLTDFSTFITTQSKITSRVGFVNNRLHNLMSFLLECCY